MTTLFPRADASVCAGDKTDTRAMSRTPAILFHLISENGISFVRTSFNRFFICSAIRPPVRPSVHPSFVSRPIMASEAIGSARTFQDARMDATRNSENSQSIGQPSFASHHTHFICCHWICLMCRKFLKRHFVRAWTHGTHTHSRTQSQRRQHRTQRRHRSCGNDK